MTQTTKLVLIAALLLALVAAPSFAASASLQATGDQLQWSPDMDFGQADLRVNGPNGFTYHRVFNGDEIPAFSLSAEFGAAAAGSYTWTLTVVSKISPELRDRMKAARANGDLGAIEQMMADAGFQSFNSSGHFVFDGLKLVVPENDLEAESRTDLPAKDQQILDDLIVAGSICAGQDCNNGESFGFDTIRLKENNLRIKAEDTSNSASFPSRDWQLTFNDSSNGGANKFSVDDIDGGRTPFTLEAGAPSHSLYVDDGGRLGFGTATPVVQLHVKDGNTPTLRLEQDGTSGFTPQTWDVAGNESNFFIRDATNGSKLSFRIEPNAPESSIHIEPNGDVGFGTSSAAANIHVRETASNVQQILLELENNGIPVFLLEDTSTTDGAWFTSVSGDLLLMSQVGTGKTELTLTGSGALSLRGGLTVCTDAAVCTPTTFYPDYVFEESYDLMPLDELKVFVEANGHLPKIPTVGDVTKEGINMTELQMSLLEKVEELTLYTLSQQELIEQQGALIQELQKHLTEK